MNEFQELEYKYRADDVGLKQFQEFMEGLGYCKHMTVSSWDTYFINDPGDFIRFRESHLTPELTVKRKTKEENNWHRVEVDLPLDSKRINRKTVEHFVKLENYIENFRIFKSCFIFFQEHINYVYYIVYDYEMREKQRFIEVEVNKDKINELVDNGIDPKELLKKGEELLFKLNISSKNRLKKSLFELYRK